MEGNEMAKAAKAQKKLENLKNWYRMIPVYTIGTMLVFGMIYFMKVNDFPEFMIYMFMTFPAVFWLFFCIQGVLVGGMNLRFLRGWEKRQIQKYMDADKKEAEKYKQIGNGYGNQ